MRKQILLLSVLIAAVSLNARAEEECNPTPSPDSSLVAFTRGGDLYVRSASGEGERRLTFDGSDVILNGYASWVYYEEILGRSTRYKAFWWSPDSRKIVFYRFDDSQVGRFPIWSEAGQYGSLKITRYPKAGTPNPSVRIGIAAADGSSLQWCSFPDAPGRSFGTPFWAPGSQMLCVPSEPSRGQDKLEIYRVDASEATSELIYTEQYNTWLDWPENVYAAGVGFYMVRSFESGWEQIYFLSYDGKTFRRLTDGQNWDVRIVRADERKGELWFMAKRGSRLHPALYYLDRKGRITELSSPDYWASKPEFSEDGKKVKLRLSTAAEPWTDVVCDARKSWRKTPSSMPAAAEPEPWAPRPVCIENDCFQLYGLISYPKGFDPSRRYPVVMQIYGGPGTPYVRDFWKSRDASDAWCTDNGAIYLVADPRSSGENGRAGMDEAFRQVTVKELGDYLAWAKYLKSLPYVDRIGVKGFSFGGTSTAMLVLRYPEYFCCGIAGGGVYDWSLYDSHYTERFMQTPEENPDGYAAASVLNYVDGLDPARVGRLMITHGTADDNVHLQNSLQLVDALQKAGIQFELMLYPGGMHGYRGAQKAHSDSLEAQFWKRWLF
ncbi:MAG: DPP IV N-terminal domain-containing protein [Bacteroidales bacterium]|nr:DPP IV N-terminal domain-containing protein [Bacteroidales bacterium]